MKRRSSLKRKTPLRSAPPRRSSSTIPGKSVVLRIRVRWRNPERHDANWRRAYHSPERVEWVKRQPCVVSGETWGLRVNAHTFTGGTGRKADYTTIIPLRADLHQYAHDHGWVAMMQKYRQHPNYVFNWNVAKVRNWLGFAAHDTQCKWEREAARLGIDP